MNEFKAWIVIETAERLRDNGYEQEASDLEWDLVVQYFAEVFFP